MIQANTHGCILALCYCAFILLVAAKNTDPREVNALRAVKKSLIDPMQYLENWKGDDPCASNWTGVFCNETIGGDDYSHVTNILLLAMNLSGSLAPELGELSYLSILDFMWNDLTGSIPKEIGNITSLQLLLLNGNQLSGSMPEELGNLVNLNRLQLDENQISGSIPKSFGRFHSMKHIHLNNNSISGHLPSELSNLSTLVHLLVDNNNLNGYLPPEYSMLSSLRILQLDGNKLEGEIPTSYSNMSKLLKLSLRNCILRGSVPDFNAWRRLLYIDLSSNQLTGPLPSSPLPANMTTIILCDNHLNGSIPESFSQPAFLQRLSLENNDLTGSVPVTIWQNKSFTATAKLSLDLQNNSLSTIDGQLNPPVNVSLRLQGNPICQKANITNIRLYCGSEPGDDESNTTSPINNCKSESCPADYFFEYVPHSCFCASPLRIGYRLKSPSFSHFPPYEARFEKYVTSYLQLDMNQMYVDSFVWEKGPRLRMYLKLYPLNSSTFKTSEVQRIRNIYTSWLFPGDDFFGPYEVLNFTLVGPYASIPLPLPSSEGMGKGVIIGITVAGIACAVVISALISFVIARRQASYQHLTSRKRPCTKISMKIEGVKSFSLKELVNATDNFNSKMQVGQGGYGKVFKGVLSNDMEVAIKRAEEGSLQGEREFLTEIELLSRLHHRNLVSLIGYCDEQGEQMLIYEFMSNGTVREWIAGKTKRRLSFRMRLRIALGASKGILYLHTEAQPPIFHRDIKASNILLDLNLTAKVADFGLSKLAPLLEDEGTVPSHVSTVVKGTPGYLDPEYLLTRKLTDKSDVYSLGVVFLELLTGMQPIHHGKNIVREVNMANETGMIFSIIDEKMGSYPSECVERFLALALSCCRDKPEKRPTMLEVVRELETILKMTPDIDTVLSGSSSTNSGKLQSSASASSTLLSRDLYASTELSGGELLSGVFPTVKPR